MKDNHRTILREFTFTCERPVSKNEKAFEERSRSVLSGVSAFLKRDIRTKGIWKISINVNSTNALQHMKVVGGVLKYNIEFDVDSFLELGVEQQKKQMLTLVIETLLDVFTEAGLDADRLNGLPDFIKEREFKSTFTGPASARNGIDACVVCEQEFERTNVFIVLKKDSHEIERIFVLETSSEEFIFNVYLKAPEWVSDVELSIEASNGETHTVRRPN